MPSAIEVRTAEPAMFGSVLCNPEEPLKKRFESLFRLRTIGDDECVSLILRCFDDSSALLKHECAYCLGQMQRTLAIPVLEQILKDPKQEPIVRHEAGEALGAIGDVSALDTLRAYCEDPIQEIAETCQLAVARIEWLQTHASSEMPKLSSNPYSSVDPAPPSLCDDVTQLRSVLLDENQNLFERYRAIFSLRNLGSTNAVEALCEGLFCPKSALFRHEIAYVLGQMQQPGSVPALRRKLGDYSDLGMVRHECAEALGSVATKECFDILNSFLTDKERVVSESCEVALDIAEYNVRGQSKTYDEKS